MWEGEQVMSTQSFGSGSTRVPARRRRVLPVVVAGMVSLGLAACGSSKSKSNAAVKPAGATETTSAAKPATGEPLKVLQVLNELPSSGLFFPEAKAAVQGRIDRLNANGGGLGRPGQVGIWVAGLDANKAADCARKAVADHYLAAVGSLFAGAPDYQKILADAGIPHLAGLPFTPGDGSYPTEFPVSAGGPAVVAGQAAYLYDVAGSRKIVVVISDSPGASASVDSANSALVSRGAKIAASVPVPRTKPDLSAEVQQAVGSGDSILFAAAGGSLAQFLSQLKTLNYTKFVVPEGSLQPALRKAL